MQAMTPDQRLEAARKISGDPPDDQWILRPMDELNPADGRDVSLIMLMRRPRSPLQILQLPRGGGGLLLEGYVRAIAVLATQAGLTVEQIEWLVEDTRAGLALSYGDENGPREFAAPPLASVLETIGGIGNAAAWLAANPPPSYPE